MPAAPPPLDALLTLRSADSRVGADRIALLEAVRDHGTITAAAKALGLSYKAAWDAVQALNNLFDRPLIAPQAGGKTGGGSVVTPAGQSVIEAFRALEVELAAAAGRLRARLDRPEVAPLLWSLSMKTSARNALRGVVTRVVPGAVNAEVTLKVAEGVEIVAIVTMESVRDLGLEPGVATAALIKSSLVLLAAGHEELKVSARNRLKGVVARREDGAVNSEITLELAAGKTLTAVITIESAEALGLTVGAKATALIKASHVILATV